MWKTSRWDLWIFSDLIYLELVEKATTKSNSTITDCHLCLKDDWLATQRSFLPQISEHSKRYEYERWKCLGPQKVLFTVMDNIDGKPFINTCIETKGSKNGNRISRLNSSWRRYGMLLLLMWTKFNFCAFYSIIFFQLHASCMQQVRFHSHCLL